MTETHRKDPPLRKTHPVEERRLRSLFERVEVVEDVARTLPEDDERRAKLLAVSDSALAEEGTILSSRPGCSG